MILTADEIERNVREGSIVIDPFLPDQLGPNSYDLTLDDRLTVYRDYVLDLLKPNDAYELRIPEGGYLLRPNTLYLGCTKERCGSTNYLTCIEGRSSIARLGIQVHLTAGFGDLGFDRQWTLEITVVQPVIIYPNIRICQAYFQMVKGKIRTLYHGKYAAQEGPTPSKSWLDF